MSYDGDELAKFGITECEVIDTMGAGDSYIAGFLMGVLEEKSIIECMKKGAMSSSKTLGYYGAW
jgi:fructoselysine 6-kinase